MANDFFVKIQLHINLIYYLDGQSMTDDYMEISHMGRDWGAQIHSQFMTLYTRLLVSLY